MGMSVPPGPPREIDMTTDKTLYARFHGPEIFLEQGRLLFALLHVFAKSGYRIRLHPYLGDKPLEKYGQMIHTLPGLELAERPAGETARAVYLHDRPDPVLARQHWAKRIEVRFDLFSPFWGSDPIIMPFPMHPMQSGIGPEDLLRLRASERKMRVFFAGDTEQYRRVWLRYPKLKLPRETIVKAVIAGSADERILIEDAAHLQRLLAGPYMKRVVLTASSQVRIEFADWLPTLARADFFLSPPGIVMPMCHNIIEAMAVGSIPITNYPEWLDPHLEPDKNCLAFDTLKDLDASLRRALAMPEEEIAAMRQRVVDHYEQHLRPDRFIERVEGHPGPVVPILMYTERNMALNAKRLGRHSILIQGTSRPRPSSLWRRLAAVYWPAHRQT